MAAIEERTLLDGGQTAQDVGAGLISWLGEARQSLDVALYDVRLPGAVGDAVADAIRAAAARGVAVRIASGACPLRPYPLVTGNRAIKPIPPPPRTEPSLLEALGVPLKAIPGDPDLMHHKFAVRDGTAVWTGSTNWTLDSWTREEHVLLTVASEGIARAYARDFDDLWRRGRVEGSGSFDVSAVEVGGVPVQAWFSPGRGPELSHRIADRPGLRPVADQRALGVEGAAARAGAVGAAVGGQGLDPVRARSSPRLHAREGLAERMAAFVDAVRARYPTVAVPSYAAG
jgi:hypothetical protein